MSRDWVPSWMKKAGSTDASPRESSTEDELTGVVDSGTGSRPGVGGLSMPITEEGVLEALKEVYDPELAISIIDLGLVYGVDIIDNTVTVTMTLTSPGCPLGPTIQALVNAAVSKTYPSVERVDTRFVWTPPWDPYTMATEEGKDMLGIW